MISQETWTQFESWAHYAVKAGLIPEPEKKELLSMTKQKFEQSKLQLSPKEKLITKKQASKLLQVSIRTLDRYHEENLIPYVRIGKRALRVPLSALESFMKNGRELN